MKSRTYVPIFLLLVLLCGKVFSQTVIIDSVSGVKSKAETLDQDKKQDTAPQEPEAKYVIVNGEPKSADSLVAYDLLKAILPTAGGLVLLLVSYIIKRNFDKYFEKNKVVDELKDLYRHFHRNGEVLEKIIGEVDRHPDKKISPTHLQKLKVIETTTLLFQAETLRNVSPIYIRRLSELKMLFRNANIEADGVIAFLESDNYNLTTLKEYLDLLQARSKAHKKQIIHVLQLMDVSFWEKTFKNIKKIEEKLPGKAIPFEEQIHKEVIKPRLEPIKLIYHLLPDKSESKVTPTQVTLVENEKFTLSLGEIEIQIQRKK